MSRKKHDTEMAFLDLMLCAIGCALLIFMAQVLQPRGRGRGWDDKPLVISCRGSGSLHSRFVWEFVREGASGAERVGGGMAILAVPSSSETENGQPMLFVIPEAEFGLWRLSVTAHANPAEIGSVLGRLKSAGLAADPTTDLLVEHHDLYARCLEVLGGRGRPVELDTLVAELKKELSSPTGVMVGGGAIKPRPDVALYLKCRRRILRAELESRANPADKTIRPNAKKEVLEYLSTEPGRKEIALGIRAELELWPPPARPGLAWEDLNRALDAHRQVGSGTSDLSGMIAAYRQELIRLRAIHEWTGPEDKNLISGYAGRADYESNLMTMASEGKKDLLCQLVVGELGALGVSEKPSQIELAIMWGDQKWPAETDPVDDVAGECLEKSGRYLIELARTELGQTTPLADITLRREDPRPAVVPDR